MGGAERWGGGGGEGGERRRAQRALALTFAVVFASVAAASPARAQDLTCDRGDREVRSLAFRGNRAFKDDELSRRVNTTSSSWARRIFRFFGTRRCLDSDELARDVLRLKFFYRQAGYFNAAVDTAVTPVSGNEVKVAFHIREGEPIRIVAAKVNGIDSLPIRGRILSGLYIGVGRRFDQMRLQADYDTIIARLRNSGYPSADVLQGADVRPESLLARLEPFVVPGPFSRFDGIEINVTPQNPEEKPQISNGVVKRLLGIDSGDVYRDRDIIRAQRNLYQTGAYRHVEVSALPDSLQPNDSLVALRVTLVEDYMRQLDTEIGWATLDCFRTRGVYTNKNLFGTARRLEITGQLSKIGIGKPLASSQTKNLCWGDLRRDPFSERANYFLGATIRQPALFGTSAVPALSVYGERHGEYLAYLRSIPIGGELSLLRNLGQRNTPLRLGYSWEYGKTEAQPAMLCAVFRRCDQESRDQLQGYLPLAVASATLARIRTDNEVAPTNGNVLRGELRMSSQLLGSDPQLTFSKGFLDGVWYHPLGAGSVLALRLRGGLILGGSGTNGGARLPPPQERLYAGGATSVRGFQQNELGSSVYLLNTTAPETLVVNDTSWIYTQSSDGTDRVVPVGGNSLVIANIEYRLRSPFYPELLQYTLFADAGEVWTRSEETRRFGFENLKWTPGLGVRIFSPLGPIQMNVAYNPYRRAAGPAYVVYPEASGFAPLYCVTPVDRTSSVPFIDQLRARGVPATLQEVSVGGTPIGPRLVQPSDIPCQSLFRPSQSRSFLRNLTLTFSIGPDF